MIKAMFSKVAAWFKDADEVPAKMPTAERVPTWTLLLGKQTMGEFTFVGYETPWITADFKPTEHFERFKPYFEWQREVNLHVDEDDWEDEPSSALDSLIDEVNTSGQFQILDKQTNEQRPMLIHFGDDYSYGTFR